MDLRKVTQVSEARNVMVEVLFEEKRLPNNKHSKCLKHKEREKEK
jgi:hypothetical protein